MTALAGRLRTAAAIVGFALAGSLCAAPITVDYSAMPTATVPSLSAGGITVTGSANVQILALNGLGISGGSVDYAVEVDHSALGGAEFIRFEFGAPVFGVSYFVGSAGCTRGCSSSGELGKRTLEAFGAGGVSLGTAVQGGTGSRDVSALFAGVPITSFLLTSLAGNSADASNVTYFRIPRVTYDPGAAVPEPSALALAAIGALALLGARRRRPQR